MDGVCLEQGKARKVALLHSGMKEHEGAKICHTNHFPEVNNLLVINKCLASSNKCLTGNKKSY